MPCLPRSLAALSCAACLVFAALPASAQWVASGRWGTETNWRYIVPGTWMVLRNDSTTAPVTIHAEGDNHVGRLEMWCNPETGQSHLRFDSYRGDALHQPGANDGARVQDPVVFVINGQRFERVFDYDTHLRVWTAEGTLDAAFLNAFSWSSRMELETPEGERITGYSMNNSGGARSALRQTCQF